MRFKASPSEACASRSLASLLTKEARLILLYLLIDTDKMKGRDRHPVSSNGVCVLEHARDIF